MGALMRYSSPVNTLADLMDEFFDGSVFESSDRSFCATWPRVDITEESNHFTLHADLAGLDKKDVRIQIENGILSIEGEKREERKREKGRYSHLERRYGHFSRSFTLPDGIDEQHIEAKMHNGVLELKLPKTEKAVRKAIEVKVN